MAEQAEHTVSGTVPYEKVFTLKTDLIEAETFINNMERFLSAYLQPADRNKLCVGLYEIIVNAIEHGNLSISYHEKQDALKQGVYEQVVQERLANKEYATKTVYINLSIQEKAITFVIRDEGEGFDWKKQRELQLNENLENIYRGNGRGIFITECYFDEIAYNEKGNEATITKHVAL